MFTRKSIFRIHLQPHNFSPPPLLILKSNSLPSSLGNNKLAGFPASLLTPLPGCFKPASIVLLLSFPIVPHLIQDKRLLISYLSLSHLSLPLLMFWGHPSHILPPASGLQCHYINEAHPDQPIYICTYLHLQATLQHSQTHIHTLTLVILFFPIVFISFYHARQFTFSHDYCISFVFLLLICMHHENRDFCCHTNVVYQEQYLTCNKCSINIEQTVST